MLTSLKEISMKFPQKIHFVPSDLLEYPVINYFQYRNNGGFLDDIQLTPNVVNAYLRYYKKDPRTIFTPSSKKKFSIRWSKAVERGLFLQSIGTLISPYVPIVNEAFKDSKFEPVKKMVIHRYKSKKKENEKTAVLFIHGYAESHFIFHEQFYFRFLNNQFNCNIFALELPYHLHRQTYDSPFSGAYFLSGNPVRMLEAFRQSIHEIKLLIHYLQGEFDRIILYGGSLGGHLVAHLSQLVDDIDIIAALASPFLFRLAVKKNIVPIARNYVDRLSSEGKTSYYKILHSTNMKYYTPFTTNEKTVIIGGEYDRIVPFEMVSDLSEMLQRPLFPYPGGHLTILLWLKPLLQQIDNFFEKKR
jgi:pimeloyl-ACP methyl ester carboxylesterase